MCHNKEFDHCRNLEHTVITLLPLSVQDYVSRFEGPLHLVPFSLVLDEGDSVSTGDSLGQLAILAFLLGPRSGVILGAIVPSSCMVHRRVPTFHLFVTKKWLAMSVGFGRRLTRYELVPVYNIACALISLLYAFSSRYPVC